MTAVADQVRLGKTHCNGMEHHSTSGHLIDGTALLLGFRRVWRSCVASTLDPCAFVVKALLGYVELAWRVVRRSSLAGRHSLPKPRSSFITALTSLWPDPVLIGLIVQLLLPVAVHPRLGPRIANVRLAGRSAARLLSWLPKPKNTLPQVLWLMRTGFRITYATVLLLSVLWVVLTIEAGVRGGKPWSSPSLIESSRACFWVAAAVAEVEAVEAEAAGAEAVAEAAGAAEAVVAVATAVLVVVGWLARAALAIGSSSCSNIPPPRLPSYRAYHRFMQASGAGGGTNADAERTPQRR